MTTRRIIRHRISHDFASFLSVSVLCALFLGVSLVGTTAAQSPSSAPTAPARSLAERLSQIRFGWGQEKEEPKPAVSRPATAPASGLPPKSSAPVRVTAQPRPDSTRRSAPLPNNRPAIAQRPAPAGVRSRLPSLDPRNLLPGDLFSTSDASQPPRQTTAQTKKITPKTSRPTSTANTAPAKVDKSAPSIGSARDRIMRDLRQRGGEPAIAETSSPSAQARSRYATPTRQQSSQQVATRNPYSTRTEATGSALSNPNLAKSAADGTRRAPARAGSVLSAQTPKLPELSVQGPQRNPAATSPTTPMAIGPSYGATPKLSRRAMDSPSKRALNKSLAAEIAREMADEVDVAAPAAEVAEAPVEVVATAEPAVQETTPAKETPTETPEETEVPFVADASESRVATEADAVAAPVAELPVAELDEDRYASEEAKPEPEPEGVAPEVVEPEVVAKVELSSSPIKTDSSLTAGAAVDGQQTLADTESQPADELEVIKNQTERANEVARSRFAPTEKSAHAMGSSNDGSLLLTEATPLVVSQVHGPRQIIIGRRASYSVLLANRGDAAADALVTRVRVPAWAEVVETSSTLGAVQRGQPGVRGGLIEWRIDKFAAHSSAKLDLKLVAREGKPIELGVDWNHAPVGSKTLVEVQEPKLEVAITGPDEVLFGKPQRYRLELSNPGTGPAENVFIHLLPPGKSPDQASRHPIGAIAAGASKLVDIELTARDAGELAILARATATGGVEAATERRMLCRRPELEVDWRGPARKYSGAEATYYFRVRNPGTATAEGVTFVVDLPEGFELQATSAGQTYDAAKRRLSWNAGALRPGDDTYLQIRGVPKAAGRQQFPLTAATADRLTSHTVTATTEVVALADLRLEIRDPKGPVPVGTDVAYEVRVKNRGANVAEQVNLVAMFSAGIEPYAVDGVRCASTDGRVALETIDRLAAGAEKVFTITARADKVGTHIFRAEVLCRELETKLAAEEMTRFYAEERLDMGEGPRAAENVKRFVYPR